MTSNDIIRRFCCRSTTFDRRRVSNDDVKGRLSTLRFRHDVFRRSSLKSLRIDNFWRFSTKIDDIRHLNDVNRRQMTSIYVILRRSTSIVVKRRRLTSFYVDDRRILSNFVNIRLISRFHLKIQMSWTPYKK